jgi:hypothetical protein
MIPTKFVVVESPFAPHGDNKEVELARNIAYVRAAMADCFRRGEVPFASHALYTLPGVLDDTQPEQRKQGMKAGFSVADALCFAARAMPWIFSFKRVFYVERGESSGMKAARDLAAGSQTTEDRRLCSSDFWGLDNDKNWTLNAEGGLVPCVQPGLPGKV